MIEETNVFESLDKQRNVELIVPDNKLKQKVGSGGIDPVLIEKAQQAIVDNKTDFLPIAESYFDILDTSTRKISDGRLGEDAAFEALFYPLVQLKAQGSMFKYPVITEISGMLINFLEVIMSLDDDAQRIVNAHKMTLKAIITNKVPGTYDTEQGQALTGALKDACLRYFKNNT